MKTYPTLNQVMNASHETLCYWYRFLASPSNDEESNILATITEKMKAKGGMTVEISKSIGWES